MKTQNREFQITRRHLPHWYLDGSLYFVTSRIVGSSLSVNEQRLIVDHVRSGHGRFYTLVAIVVMPDHLHIILFADKGYPLGRIMKRLKGPTARIINKQRGTKGSFWQNESFDRIIRSEREFYRKLLYMLYNPVKAGLTNDPMNYPGWYCNEEFLTAG